MTLNDRRSARFSARLRRKIQYSCFRQQWNVALTPYSAPIVAGLEGASRQRQALDELCWMPERRDIFLADPFIVADTETPGDFLIYYEHFPWRVGRGSIYCVRFHAGSFDEPVVVLESPHHLSYPFIMLVDGRLAMIPEHSAAQDLSLYPLDHAGRIERKVTIRQDLSLVDSTVVHWEGRYWMFATHAGGNDNSVLYIYYADAPEGPWAPHARNPVKRDIGNSRPAGSFIVHRGALFRPAQDCAAYYGSGVVINEVLRLTEDEFEERQVGEIRPPSGSRYHYGLHTISSVHDHTAIDGARMESSLHPSLDRFGRYFKA